MPPEDSTAERSTPQDYLRSRDLDGWRWAGTLTGLILGATVMGTGIPSLLVHPDPESELTNEQIWANVGISVGAILIAGGLTVAGYFITPALAESGDWNDGVGYVLALGELFAVLGAGVGVSAASVAEGSLGAMAAAGAGAGVGAALVGVLLGAALHDDDAYEDRRLMPLFGAAGIALLVFLGGALIAGIAGAQEPWDELALLGSSAGLAAGLGAGALAAAR